jgi:hypothetical protein
LGGIDDPVDDHIRLAGQSLVLGYVERVDVSLGMVLQVQVPQHDPAASPSSGDRDHDVLADPVSDLLFDGSRAVCWHLPIS